MNETYLYPYSAQEARTRNQLPMWRESYHANVACRNAIEETIRQNFNGMNLKKDCLEPVLAEYGYKRTEWVLATTLQELSWDGRFSRANKQWAARRYIPQDERHNAEITVRSHPAILDGFVDLYRKAYQELGLFGPEHCVGDRAEQDYIGKVLVLSPDTLKESCWSQENQLWYIHFTEEQKQRAAAVDLEEFLRCRGEKLLSSGREKRLASDHSVTVRGNEWYDHAEERGGHAVSFVQRFYGLSYPDAVTMLLGGELGTAYPSAGERTEEPAKPFALPPANKDMRRVFAYLIKHRSIARDVVAHFAKAGLLYEDAEYHNAVFVGTDTDGVPRHAHKRSANSYGKAFRLNVEGSDPRYSFHYVGTDRSLYVFEAPIDMLSFITLYPENWQRHSYVACCGTSIQPVLQMLEQAPQLDTVLLCLDNDEAGHQASRRMREQLEARYSVERLIPENKDWNDDLTLSDENAQGFAMNELR